MRTSILLLAVLGTLAFGVADARPGNDSRPAHVSECDVLKDGSKGLHGLCVSFCAQQGRSHVNLNDIASVRAASSDVSILNRYNRLMRDGDPEMPCMPDSDSDTPPPADEPPPSDEPPAATSCPCWSGTDGAARLASIDGVTGVDPSFAKCTTLTSSTGLVYRKELKEGEGASSADDGAVVGVAWASMATSDGFSRYNGCYIDTADGQVGIGITLGLDEAQLCAAEVADQCASLGNP